MQKKNLTVQVYYSFGYFTLKLFSYTRNKWKKKTTIKKQNRYCDKKASSGWDDKLRKQSWEYSNFHSVLLKL